MNVRSCTETTNAVAFVANKGERAKMFLFVIQCNDNVYQVNDNFTLQTVV